MHFFHADIALKKDSRKPENNEKSEDSPMEFGSLPET
jgi:hypothetical protein